MVNWYKTRRNADTVDHAVNPQRYHHVTCPVVVAPNGPATWDTAQGWVCKGDAYAPRGLSILSRKSKLL